MRRLYVLSLFVCLVVCSCSIARAQEFRAAYPGTGSVTLSGNWQFHTSDDLSWAQTGFDDSHWETISADKPWGAQTHVGHVGFAWYRRAVEIHGVTGPLSIGMPPVGDAFEVYWNGQKMGGDGTLPPHANYKATPTSHVIALPTADASGLLKGELAVRVWKAPLTTLDDTDVGGFEKAPRIGDSTVIAEEWRLGYATAQQRHLLAIIECALMLAIGLFALGTWARNRRSTVFLWLGLFLCATSGWAAFNISAFFEHITVQWFQTYVVIILTMSNLAMWALIMTLFGLVEERRWRVLTAYMAAVLIVAQAIDLWTSFEWANAGPGIQTVDWVMTVIFSIVPLYELVLLVAGLRRRRDWDLVPMAVTCCALDLYEIANGALRQGDRYTHFNFTGLIARLTLHVGPDYTLVVRDQLTAILLVVLVWTVLRQQAKERRQQGLLEAEVKSAREVQQVLVPEAMEPVPGYAISSLYWPAEEVGGDLFQVLPGRDGDALVVLADVSGKGLKAAMTVSVLVGAIRTLAEYTMDPAEVLRGLNRRLMGRTDGGFATCLVLHVTANGEVAMGNAGHLAPFLNGEEMAVPGSLPLGIAYDAEFELSQFVLREDDEVTMYTDGVLEAQSKSGELYGFERTKELMRARPSVQAIAEAAKKFGQKDDVTLVKIARVHDADLRPRVSVDLQTVEMREAMV